MPLLWSPRCAACSAAVRGFPRPPPTRMLTGLPCAGSLRVSTAYPRGYTFTMTTTAEEVLKEALQLSEVERARVAAELLASLEPDVETRDGEAWIAEVERRAQAAIGGLPGLTWEDTRTRIEERISRTRKSPLSGSRRRT